MTNKDFVDIVSDESLIAWAESSLKERKVLRGGYREFIELSHTFTGLPLEKEFTVLVDVQTWIFHEQFKLTDREKNGILQMCIFAVKIILKVWIKAPLAAAAPSNGLKLFKSIQEHASVNHALSKPFLSKFCSHLWCLSEELVALVFFAQPSSFGTERLMVQAMKQHNETEDAPKR